MQLPTMNSENADVLSKNNKKFPWMVHEQIKNRAFRFYSSIFVDIIPA